jgi:hypothetical protein
MKDFLRNIDFISKEENLRINKKNRYENVLGGIISFFISAFSVLITIYFFLEMFYSQDPKIITSKGLSDELNNYTLSKDEIQFFISLEYSNATYYLDETVYKVSGRFTEIKFINEKGKTNQVFKVKELQLIKCIDIYDKEEIFKQNLKFPIQYFYCIKPEDRSAIGGIWGSEYFSKVEVFVTKCKNETLNSSDKPCKPNDEIDGIIENGIVSMYTSDHFIDNLDIISPTKKILKNNFDRISNKFKMNYIITYSTNYYNNDIGWILPKYAVEKFPTIEDYKISQQFGNLDNIIQVQIQTSPIKYNYIRYFIKIQDVLTKIGGCIKAFILIGYALNFLNSYAFSIIDNVIDNHFDHLSDELEDNFIKLPHPEIIRKPVIYEKDNKKKSSKQEEPREEQNSEQNLNNERELEIANKRSRKNIVNNSKKFFIFLFIIYLFFI